MPADNAPEQHGSHKECDKVPADNSKNVNSDNEPHNANTNPCETAGVGVDQLMPKERPSSLLVSIVAFLENLKAL